MKSEVFNLNLISGFKASILIAGAIASIILVKDANSSNFTYKGQYGCIRTDDGKPVCRSEATGKYGFVSEGFFREFSKALENSTVKTEVRVSSGEGYSEANLNVRSSPSANASRVGTLTKGDRVSISGEVYEGGRLTDWIRINFGGSFGFVHRGYISDKPTIVQKIYDIENFEKNLWEIAGQIEVRSEPKNESRVECAAQDEITVVGRVLENKKPSDWMQIEISCGNILHSEDRGTSFGYVKAEDFERAKVAIDLSEDQAYEFLSDIQDFVALNPGVLSPLRLALLFQPATNELTDSVNVFKASGSKFVELYQFANAEPQYVRFHSDRILRREKEKAVVALSLKKEFQDLLSSAQDAVARDPLSDQAIYLSQILVDYESRNIPVDHEGLEAEIRSLRNRFASAGFDPISKAETDPTRIANNSATTGGSHFSDVGDYDVMLIVNILDRPPHAFRNLSGDVSFDKGKARLCAPVLDDYELPYRKYFGQKFAELFGDTNVDVVRSCSEGLQGLDGLIVRGVDLVRAKDIPQLKYLADGLDQKVLAKIILSQKSEFDEKMAELMGISKSITDMVSNGEIVGYGFIRFENSSPSLCVALDGDQDVHRSIIEEYVGSEAFLSQPDVEISISSTVDEAFRKVQRAQCRMIYANHVDLKKVHDATQLLGLATEFVPAWVDSDKVANVRNEIEQQARELAAMRSASVAQQQTEELEEAKRQAALKEQLSVQRAEFRARYGDRAKSLISEINATVLGSIKEIYDITKQRRSPNFSENKFLFYENINRWFYDQSLKGWELDSLVPDVHEYGVVSWGGRNIEAVIAKIELNTKNRAAGMYGQDCWYVGYVNDQEFGVKRDPISVQCDDANAYQSWVDRLQFSSQWNP